MDEQIKEADLVTRIGYIKSVSESCHPADTPQRKIGLMLGHAKKALVKAKKLQTELDKAVQFAERVDSGSYCGEKDCPAYLRTLAKAVLNNTTLGKCKGHILRGGE